LRLIETGRNLVLWDKWIDWLVFSFLNDHAKVAIARIHDPDWRNDHG
jgi:hypothetical protein